MAARGGSEDGVGVPEPPGSSSATPSRDVGRALRAEGGLDLGREQFRLLPGGEVAAAIDLVEVRERGVAPLGPGPRCPPDLAGERVKPTGTATSGGVWAARAWVAATP